MEQNEIMRLLKGSDDDKRQLLQMLVVQVVAGDGLSDLEVGIYEYLNNYFLGGGQ
jgi:hypothetical protein